MVIFDQEKKKHQIKKQDQHLPDFLSNVHRNTTNTTSNLLPLLVVVVNEGNTRTQLFITARQHSLLCRALY